MVEVKTFGDGSDLQLIHGYGDGGFRVSQERYAGDLFLLPRQATSWNPPAHIDELGANDLLPLMAMCRRPCLSSVPARRPCTRFSSLETRSASTGLPLRFCPRRLPAGHGTC